MKQLTSALIALFFMGLTSCVSLSAYDALYINDDEMDMTDNASDNFENYVHTIREGATTSGSSKSSGGCGCY